MNTRRKAKAKREKKKVDPKPKVKKVSRKQFEEDLEESNNSPEASLLVNNTLRISEIREPPIKFEESSDEDEETMIFGKKLGN